MADTPNCIKCNEENTYFDGSLFVCPDCSHEWTKTDAKELEEANKVVDSTGEELMDGDDVSVIKDLKVKGSSMVVKRGTRVRGIRLSQDDPTHVEGRVDGQSIMLMTSFLKK